MNVSLLSFEIPIRWWFWPGENKTQVAFCENRFQIVAVNHKVWIVDCTHGILRDNRNFDRQSTGLDQGSKLYDLSYVWDQVAMLTQRIRPKFTHECTSLPSHTRTHKSFLGSNYKILCSLTKSSKQFSLSSEIVSSFASFHLSRISQASNLVKTKLAHFVRA